MSDVTSVLAYTICYSRSIYAIAEHTFMIHRLLADPYRSLRQPDSITSI